MNVKMIKKTGVFLIFSTCLISGCDSDIPIPKFIKQKAVSAVGVKFSTGEPLVLDTETGITVPPCIPEDKPDQKSYHSIEGKKEIKTTSTKSDLQKCKAELIFDKNNPELMNAIELTQEPITGEIVTKGGEVKVAETIFIAITTYRGSHCNTVHSGGNQYDNCCRRC